MNRHRAVHLVAELVYSLDNSLWFRKRYSVSHLTCLWFASYARRQDNLRQYASQVLAWYVTVVVLLWMVVFHPPTGLACAFPFFLDSRVPTCDMTGENPMTSSGCCWFLACCPAILPVAGQSGVTSSLLVKSHATVGSELLLLGLVDEERHPHTLLHHLDQQRV